jgi:UMF1 family MFS transporter
VVLLLLVYVGFIAGDGPRRGLLDIPVADGTNVRAAMLLAAAWLVIFGLPLLLTARGDTGPVAAVPRGILGGYRQLVADLRTAVYSRVVNDPRHRIIVRRQHRNLLTFFLH